jgi:hydrogenase nickel incorporation protein HypB
MPVKELPVHLSDDAVATALRDELDRAGILSVALVGPPGAGKTALVEATARELKGKIKIAIITANPAADRDVAKLSSCCTKVVGIKTATPCAELIRDALRKVGTYNVDLLLIESMGGLAATPDLGQDLTVSVLSTSGGDDKAAEYGELLAHSCALVLTKADLHKHVAFDRTAFRDDLIHINPSLRYMEVSAVEGSGMGTWTEWLKEKLTEKNARFAAEAAAEIPAEWFFG